MNTYNPYLAKTLSIPETDLLGEATDNQELPQTPQENQPIVAHQPDKRVLPVLPLRDVVVFPHVITSLMVGRASSLAALDMATTHDGMIFLLTQKDPNTKNPQGKDLYEVGCVGKILQCLKLPDNTVKVVIDGVSRGKVVSFGDNQESDQPHTDPADPADPHEDTNSTLPMIAEVAYLHNEPCDEQMAVALRRALSSVFSEYVKLAKRVSSEFVRTLEKTLDPAQMSDIIAHNLQWEIPERQSLLEKLNIQERVEMLCDLIGREVNVYNTERKIHKRVKKQIERTQQEYYLNEQVKAIQKELGEEDDARTEMEQIARKIKSLKMTKEAKEKALSELKKLKSVNAMSAESTVIRNYIDWLVNVPWQKNSKLVTDLIRSRKILDEDHYGLDKVKERVMEYLAVQRRIKSVSGTILCFVGPPGVGKTSLGKSIARASNRKFVRISLGGMRDESEIRGHRRTYIGSMPGKIIQAMRKVGVSNPLILLDEIDKVGMDWRGDPSSALLEVLDPEQNVGFNDHYLDVDYDLSQVMFVTTANTLSMPRPLLDRLEIIRLSGYTETEKMEVSKLHLIPKQLRKNGLKPKEIHFTDQSIQELIRKYTREAGVRNLEREVANVCRKSVLKLEQEASTQERNKKDKDKKSKKTQVSTANEKSSSIHASTPIRVTTANIRRFAGVPKFRYGESTKVNTVGTTNGLAWTEVGGEILSIESLLVHGKGKVSMTGKLGEVMRESVRAAESLVKSRASELGIVPTMLTQWDIHVHVPEGAVPKDGPSAGLAMVTSIVSLLTGNPVRKDVAMTGEITLRGRVLAIGGLKEKLLAALRSDIKTVLIPKENEDQLSEIPKEVTRKITIIPVDTIDDALPLALVNPLSPVVWDDNEVSRVFGYLRANPEEAPTEEKESPTSHH